MRLKKLYTTFLLLGISLFFSSFMHPLKVSMSLFQYDHEKSSVKIECRVFIDDFETSINKARSKNFEVCNFNKEFEEAIENYFENQITFTVNKTRIPLKVKDLEVLEVQNIVVIKFFESDLKIKKGDELLIVNTLFFDDYEFLQTNRMVLGFPPFFPGYYAVTTMANNSFSYTF